MGEPDRTLFAQALRHALTERDLTLDRVQARLAERGISVGRSTLSFWQNGRRVPRGLSSLRVVAALEEILDVTPGLLTGPLGENPTPGEHVTLGSADDQVGDLLDVIDAGSLLDAIRVRQGITRVWVSQTGGYDRIDVDLVLRATRPINRIPIVVFGGAGVDAARMQVTVDGGRVGRTASGREVLVVEVLLDRDYRKGELLLLRYAVRQASPVPQTEFVKFSEGGGTLSGLVVTFHPDLLPVQVEHFEAHDMNGSDLAVLPLHLGASRRVSVVRERVRRGVTGIRWQFADQPRVAGREQPVGNSRGGAQRAGAQRGGIE